tara:strand:- start:68 stop:364 length:297 start_codon:yes stop_codon:yes gene_type:complete
MVNGEKLITAILTQAVDDAKYTGTRKQYLKHKIEAINWIMSDDPQFKYYCRLLNIEPSYIKNKIRKHTDTSFTIKQKPMVKTLVAALLKKKNYEQRRR